MKDRLTLRLEPRLKSRLDRLARAMDRSTAWLAAEAIKHYLDLNEWQMAAVREGLHQADRGRAIDHEHLKTKWGRRFAAAADKRR
ncbi:MAG: ribbon-helix-helix protein, CopG family [Pseudomonadota bacterium]